MSMLNAIHAVEEIRRRLGEYALDEAYISVPEVRNALSRFWLGDASSLVSDLWLEASWPHLASEYNMSDLATLGLIDTRLISVIKKHVDPSRLLYMHQYDAIRLECEMRSSDIQPTILITAGTGSGKTEAFLLPMLNRLISKPKQGSGVRAIIIYPMNALVFDQMNRLDKWLDGNNLNLTFGVFTSNTPEKDKNVEDDCISGTATPKRVVQRTRLHKPAHFLRSREAIR